MELKTQIRLTPIKGQDLVETQVFLISGLAGWHGLIAYWLSFDMGFRYAKPKLIRHETVQPILLSKRLIFVQWDATSSNVNLRK